MSLIRQVWLLVVGIIVSACVGSIVVSVWTARTYLETQLALKNNDNAQSLALTLTQQGGNKSLIELALSAQFDTGYYQSIRWLAPNGKVLAEQHADAVEINAPTWFVRVVPIEPHPGVAQLSSGWKSQGSVEVISQPGFAYADLWSGTLRIAACLLVLGLIGAAVGHLAVRRLAQHLDAVVEQAQALTERRFISVKESPTPELKRVTQAMNSMVGRVKDMFGEQAQQVEQLRRDANCDPLTGVSHRRHFLSQLETQLQRDDSVGQGWLVMVRFLRLAQTNRTLGHVRADALLRRLARSLTLPLHGGGAPDAVGRLNGADFSALLLSPTDGQADLRELLQRVQAALSGAAGVAIVASAVAWRRGDTVAQLLSSADAALARAESRGDFSFDIQPAASADVGAGGEEGWRRSLTSALKEQRTRLEEFPLVDPDGKLVHRECPLRLQFKPDGAYESAAVWLPYAIRTRMTATIDEEALDLAMGAIATDAQPRGINMAAASLLDVGLITRLRQRVSRVPQAAQRLSIEIDEVAAATQAGALIELCRQLRPLGVRIGLEHAGERLSTLGTVLESGLDYVKLDRSFVAGISTDTSRTALVRGTTSMLHGLGLRVYAEGIDDPADLKVLWACGLDGATGPAVRVQ
jgi:diguanylate cyclase (GGDEF)-like protein